MRSIWFIALTAIAVPAFAQDSGEASKKDEKKICRSVATTGSILRGKRECHTKAEWDAMSEKWRNSRDRNDQELRGRGGAGGFDRKL